MPDTCGTVPTVASVLTRQRSRERARCASPAREGWPSTAQAHRKVPWSAQLGSWASTLCYLCTRSWSVDHTISDHITSDLLNEQASLQFWLKFMPQVGSRGWGHTVWDTSGSTEAKYPRHTHHTQSGSLGSSAALDPKLFGFVLFFRFRVGNWSMFLTFWVFLFDFPFWFWRAARRSTWCRLRFAIDGTRHTAPIHTPFPFDPFPPAGSWRWRSGVRNASVKPEQRSFLADVPKEGWRAGISKSIQIQHNSTISYYIWVVKTWPLAESWERTVKIQFLFGKLYARKGNI